MLFHSNYLVIEYILTLCLQDKCDLRPHTAPLVDKVNKVSFQKPSLPLKESRGWSSSEVQRRLKHQCKTLNPTFTNAQSF